MDDRETEPMTSSCGRITDVYDPRPTSTGSLRHRPAEYGTRSPSPTGHFRRTAEKDNAALHVVPGGSWQVTASSSGAFLVKVSGWTKW